MSGIDDGFFREGKDFFADPGKKELAVTSRQIPATYAVGKKDIAAKKPPGGGKIKAETAGAVAGNKEESGARPTRRNGAAFLE